MTKKCIPFIICILGIANIAQAKNYEFTINGLKYWIFDDMQSVSVGWDYESEPPVGHVAIPSTVTYRNKQYAVKTIESEGFLGCSKMTSISIPPTVEDIGDMAFSDCESLQFVNIPDAANTIGKEAFRGCENLMEVFSQRANRMFPIDSISSYYETFDIQDDYVLCRINEDGKTLAVYKPTNQISFPWIYIPEIIEQDSICYIVTSIADDAFKGCIELQDVYIPSSVSYIGKNAFSGCVNLKRIFVPNGTLDEFSKLLPKEQSLKLQETDFSSMDFYNPQILSGNVIATPVIKKDEEDSVLTGFEPEFETPLPPPPVDGGRSLITDEDRIYDICEQMPTFPGDVEGLIKFLAEHIKYPDDAVKAGIEGRVIVSFVIKKDGSVDNVQLVRSVFPSLDREAMRVAKQLEFIPGKDGSGEPLNMNYMIPVTFSLKDK